MTNGRLITGCLILLLVTGPVLAAPFHYPPLLVAQRDTAGNGGISLDEAVSQARQQYKGQVLSAETTTINGRKVYHIKILTKDGRVKRTQVDARSGQSLPPGR
jgi:uncharacterized iron-regulated membrane protein